MSIDGHRIICTISRDSLVQVLHLLETFYESVEEHTLEAKYQELSQSDKEPLPTTPPSFKSDMFLEITRQALAIICQVLDYDHDMEVDGVILNVFSLLWPP